MNSIQSRCLTASLVALLSLLPVSSAFAEEGELWQMEVKMEMAGMPSMPAQSVQQCLPKQSAAEREESVIPKDASCKMTELKKSGNKTTFKMACNGKGNSMTGSGEVEQLGSNGYRGTTHMVINNQGQGRMEMTQSFSSKRIGKCDYQPPK